MDAAVNEPHAPLSREEALNATGAPIVVFDGVSLAFDERVVLHRVSFTLILGHTKIILGASGAGSRRS